MDKFSSKNGQIMTDKVYQYLVPEFIQNYIMCWARVPDLNSESHQSPSNTDYSTHHILFIDKKILQISTSMSIIVTDSNDSTLLCHANYALDIPTL